MNASRTRKPDLSALKTRIDALEAELAACQRLANDLRESEERLRILTEATGETVAILERHVVVECNDRVRPMFGYEVADAIGRPALAFVAPVDHERVTRHIQAAYEEPYEALALRRDGTTFLAQFRGLTTTFRGRPARVTIVRDLTGRELLTAHDAAAQAQMRLIPLATGAVLFPLCGVTPPVCIDHARGQLVAQAGAARLVVIDVSGVVDLAPEHLAALQVLARELAAGDRRTRVTGVAPERRAALLAGRPELADLELRPTVADALREHMSAGT